MSDNYLIIDASYFIFYRVYALTTWWRNSHDGEVLEEPFNNEEFINKYKSTMKTKIQEIKKKLNIQDAQIMIGKDCPRNNIWRNEYIEKYKGNRKCDNIVGQFFKLTYEENLFENSGVQKILFHPNLEADDCIALATNIILQNNNNAQIYIITSDTDYLQLINENIHIYNMKLKKIDEKKSYKNPEKDLFCKIILGDKSDNIPGLFKKCGNKTAEKYYENKELFKKKLEDKEIEDRFKLNELLISFKNIPEKLQEQFYEQNFK